MEAAAPQHPEPASATAAMLSIVTPAFNEFENLPVLYERLRTIMATVDMDWEWLVVDDHSRDATFAVLSDLSRRDPRVRAIRLARNSGAHVALSCGIHHADGDCVVVLGADMQDPPELIPELVTQWRAGIQIVWAARRQREGETIATIGFSRIYFWMMRHVCGVKEIPATGADFFLVDRVPARALSEFREAHVNILALLAWMGFRQATITYDKQLRLHGQSGWNLAKKLKMLVDSITAFSYLPIRAMSYLGFAVATAGFLYALFIVIRAFGGIPVEGWASLMVVLLVLGGFQMVMMGVLGEYLWRALDESRRRPRYVIEAIAGQSAALRQNAPPARAASADVSPG